MNNSFEKNILKKIKNDYELEKKSAQFNQIEKDKKKIEELRETIKNHKSDSYEKDFFKFQKEILKKRIRDIPESN